MVGCTEKVQYLQRCTTHNIRQPRVAYTIVWQPWAIKSTTLTALVRIFHNVIYINIRYDLMVAYVPNRNTDGVDACVLQTNGFYAML